MYELKSKLTELKDGFELIKNSLNLPEKESRLKELESQSTDPDLWSDQNNARRIMQEIGDIRNDLEEIKSIDEELSIFETLADDETGAAELEKEMAKAGKRIEKFKLKTYLSGKNDGKNAIVGIHAGQGGTEAMDWTSILFRMYLRFCERRNWKTEIIDETKGEEAGFKSITFRVEGNSAYGYFKGESGTHRLVRQSPFNADNLRQTSFALVEILPELEEVDLPDVKINEEDLDIQFYRAGGHGGQNVNKVSTAVRLTHRPTGIVVTAQTERFQEQNRKIAMNLLRSKLWVRAQEEAAKEKKDLKGEWKPASWGTQIRSYVLHPYKMVKDLRTGVETSQAEAVLDGEIDDFIEAELAIGR